MLHITLANVTYSCGAYKPETSDKSFFMKISKIC